MDYMDYKGIFIETLRDAGAIRRGAFRLKNGTRSNVFIDFGSICYASQLKKVGHCFAGIVFREIGSECFDIVFGPPYKGITLATTVALSLVGDDKEISSFRKEEKDHGEGGIFIGATPKRGDRILIVDDVITDGFTKAESISMIEETGATVVGILVGVDRREDKSLGDFIQINENKYRVWSVASVEDFAV